MRDAKINQTLARKPALNALAAACRAVLQVWPAGFAATTAPRTVVKKSGAPGSRLLQAFCVSALALNGAAARGDGNLGQQTMGSGYVTGQSLPNSDSITPEVMENEDLGLYGPDQDEEEVGYQYSHYQEGKRDLWTQNADGVTGANGINHQSGPFKAANNFNPITVDTEHAFARMRLSDRIHFGFNYNQDVWGGATPWMDSPAGRFMTIGTVNSSYPSANRAAASYDIFNTSNQFFDANGKPVYLKDSNALTGQFSTAPNRIQHVMGYASPEVRNQIDFKLGYDWNNAALDVGGGQSIEHDYASRYGNLAARMDFNQKRTTLNMGLSYTNSATHATLNNTNAIFPNEAYDPEVKVTPFVVALGNPTSTMMENAMVTGNREDGAFSLALSQVLTKNSVASGGFNFTRSTGFLGNPYKEVLAYFLDANWRTDGTVGLLPSNAYPGLKYSPNQAEQLLEKRPNQRNQFTWDASYRHFVEPLNGAAKLSYSFFHDDWGINAHTFDFEWRQSLFDAWLLTPSVRYYSQSQANFYTPYLLIDTPDGGANLSNKQLYGNYSTDQRLAAYGSISAGVSLSRQVARGLELEMGYQYYLHKAALYMGGDNSANDFMDFRYYTVNAGIRANLAQLAGSRRTYQGSGIEDWFSVLFEDDPKADNPHARHRHMAGHGHNHAKAPAGVMFAHTLDKAGDYMFGYRLMHSQWQGAYLQGNQPVSDAVITSPAGNTACAQANQSTFGHNPTSQCYMYTTRMLMDMHMLDLMYAPTDWLTLMLMPQFMSMSMNMNMPVYMNPQDMGGMFPNGNMRSYMYSGGFGDTSAYAMLNLWGDGNHKLILTHGISAPTGGINIRGQFMRTQYYPYDMQLGSGTWDYKPSLTYTGQWDDVFWGGQVNGIHRLQSQNSSGYRLGDVFQATAWGGYQFNDWFSGTVRGLYTGQGKIVGIDQNILQTNSYLPQMPMPDAYSNNYGGTTADLGIGFTLSIPRGRLAGNMISAEWLQPMYTNYQGYQVERYGTLAVNWMYMF